MDTVHIAYNKSMTDYIERINRVMDYIESHLHLPLTLDTLADIACFSKFHFHRIFHSVTGERLAECIQRIRIEKAASLLKNNPRDSITEIALLCGFSSSASFANAFKKHFGMSASDFRNDAGKGMEQRYIYLPEENLDSLDIRIEQSSDKLTYYIKGTDYQRQVDVVTLPVWSLAYVRFTGPYKGDSALFATLWKKLVAWAAPRGLLENPDNVYIALYHDNPEITAEENLRVSVCIGINEDMETSGEIGKMTVPGGTYAVCRFLCGEKDYSAAWGWVYGTWLPLSGFEPDDRPSFEWYPPHGEKTGGKIPVDICVPVKVI
jgi:AraC family transcriptional regulator